MLGLSLTYTRENREKLIHTPSAQAADAARMILHVVEHEDFAHMSLLLGWLDERGFVWPL